MCSGCLSIAFQDGSDEGRSVRDNAFNPKKSNIFLNVFLFSLVLRAILTQNSAS